MVFFPFHKSEVRERSLEIECSERGESTRGKRQRGFYRAGAGCVCQALRNSWSICPCLQPVFNKKELKRRRGWTGLGASNRLQMPLLERAPCEKVGPPLSVPSHPLEKRALLYCKGALGTLWGLSMVLGWGTGRIQGGPVFSAAAPSIEAGNVMGAPGALQGV